MRIESAPLIEYVDFDNWIQKLAREFNNRDIAGIITPIEFGVVGDGITDNTVGLQAMLDYAYQNESSIFFPKGTYLTGALTYHGQSMYGVPGGVYTTSGATGQDISKILGKDSEDIFAFPDPASTTRAYLAGTIIKDLKIIVDDTTDASGSFSRGGVGNAAFALQNANGAATHTYGVNMFLEGAFINVTIGSKSGTSGGQNKSCGIYQQGQPFGTMFQNVALARLVYGFWGDQPTSNPASEEYAPDALSFTDTVFHQCTNPLRIYNSSYSTINGMQIYGAAAGLKGVFLENFTALVRAASYQWYINGLFVELSASTTGETSKIEGFRHFLKGNTLKGDYGEHYITWNASSCVVDGASILGNTTSVAVLRFGTSAHSNRFINIAAKNTTDDFVSDSGYGNLIEVNSYDNVDFTSSRHVATIAARPGSAFLRRADFAKRGPSTPYFSDEDLFIWPSDIVWTGESPNLTVTKDSTIAESGEYVTQPSPGGGYFSIVNRETMTLGYRVPETTVRIYVKAKMASSQTTQTWSMQVNAVTKVSAALTIGTSWTVVWFEVDLTGLTKGHTVLINSASPTSNQAVDVAWIAIVPFKEYRLDIPQNNVPTSITVNTGTPTGTVSDVQAAFDGNTLDIAEVTGTPGFDVEFAFSGVSLTTNKIQMRLRYSGSSAHGVGVDAYNESSTSWDRYTHFVDHATDDFFWVEVTFPDVANYIDSSQGLKLRLYHYSAGNAAHDLYIDYVGLRS